MQAQSMPVALRTAVKSGEKKGWLLDAPCPKVGFWTQKRQGQRGAEVWPTLETLIACTQQEGWAEFLHWVHLLGQ